MNDQPEPRPKREPSADLRAMASTFHEMFTAFVDEGFTEQQALAIIAIMISNQPSSDTDG